MQKLFFHLKFFYQFKVAGHDCQSQKLLLPKISSFILVIVRCPAVISGPGNMSEPEVNMLRQ